MDVGTKTVIFFFVEKSLQFCLYRAEDAKKQQLGPANPFLPKESTEKPGSSPRMDTVVFFF